MRFPPIQSRQQQQQLNRDGQPSVSPTKPDLRHQSSCRACRGLRDTRTRCCCRCLYSSSNNQKVSLDDNNAIMVQELVLLQLGGPNTTKMAKYLRRQKGPIREIRGKPNDVMKTHLATMHWILPAGRTLTLSNVQAFGGRRVQDALMGVCTAAALRDHVGKFSMITM